jgi:TPP-dependent 2-oxoacid decarboxylase
MIATLFEKELQRNQEGLTEAITEAAEMINKSKRPVFIAGVELKRYRLSSSLKKLIEKVRIPPSLLLLLTSLCFPILNL